MDGRRDQRVHQHVVAQQTVASGAGQAQRLAEQIIALIRQEAQQHLAVAEVGLRRSWHVV